MTETQRTVGVGVNPIGMVFCTDLLRAHTRPATNVRQILADVAHRLAWTNLRDSRDATSTIAKRHFLERSWFWGDVEAWIIGLGTWRELRDAHERPPEPPTNTHTPIIGTWR